MKESQFTVPAHAKLNLSLEVLGKRVDGFHEIRSLMCSLTLHDTIILEAAPTIETRCTAPELAGPENLAHRAALLLRDTAGIASGARIAIEKRIPIAAGLGGGSSDAAATLVGLNRLWEAGLSRETLHGLAAQLGSDVPFCLDGGMALAGGRGEQLTPLPPLPPLTVLLVHPPVRVSTAAVYGGLTPVGYSDGQTTERLASLVYTTPPSEWPLVNALEPVTCRAYPVVQDVLALLRHLGAPALMCGSGPTCFALFESAEPAEQGAQAAHARGWEAWITSFAADSTSITADGAPK